MPKGSPVDLLVLLTKISDLEILLYAQGFDLDGDEALVANAVARAKQEYRSARGRRSYLETQFSIFRPRLTAGLKSILEVLDYSDLCALADRDRIRNRLGAIFAAQRTAIWLKRASKVQGCGRNAMLATDWDDGGILVPYACNSPVCPACSRRKSAERFAQVETMIEDRLRRPREFRVITFTVRNLPEGRLKVGLDQLHDAWRNFRRKCKDWSERVDGYLYNVEITYSRRTPGLPWHPHIHVVAEGSYWPQALLARAWSEWCGRAGLEASEKGSVRIEALRGENQRSAIKEVCKYTLKPFEKDLDARVVIELMTALQGDESTGRITRRFRGACGTLALLPEDKDTRWAIQGGVGWLLESDESPLPHDDGLKSALASALRKCPDIAREISRGHGRVAHLIRSGNLDKRPDLTDNESTATAE